MKPSSRSSRRGRLALVVGAVVLAAVSGASTVAGRPPVDDGSAPATTYMAGKGGHRGIDVSSWQGTIGWTKVAAEGIDFAILKATEGQGLVDPQYERNHRLADRRGIKVTAYHYARPDRSHRDAYKEADFFVKHADLRGRDLVPALDLETTGGLGRKGLQRWTMAWLWRVEQHLGVKPMIYTSPGFWWSYLDDREYVARNGFDEVWVAHWGTWKPRVPADGWNSNGWRFWQWTSRGHVDGIHGFVDQDWYNGERLIEVRIRRLRRTE